MLQPEYSGISGAIMLGSGSATGGAGGNVELIPGAQRKGKRRPTRREPRLLEDAEEMRQSRLAHYQVLRL